MKPFVGNAADEEQVKDAKRKEKRTRERELSDLRQVLSAREGRRFFWRYLKSCGVFQTSYLGGQTPESHTFFLEGQRGIGLKLLRDLNESEPDAYLLMMKEAQEDEEKEVWV